jgi:hypothetical protein
MWNQLVTSHSNKNYAVTTAKLNHAVNLIASTTTRKGLQVYCELDSNEYPKGIKVTDAEMDTIKIDRNLFHGEWNYTISP